MSFGNAAGPNGALGNNLSGSGQPFGLYLAQPVNGPWGSAKISESEQARMNREMGGITPGGELAKPGVKLGDTAYLPGRDYDPVTGNPYGPYQPPPGTPPGMSPPGTPPGMSPPQLIPPGGNVTGDNQLRSGSTPYQPPPGNPQQLQQISQGQPTLVNQLAPPPPQGPAPGHSITQVPPPMPQAQPAPQPRPQPQPQVQSMPQPQLQFAPPPPPVFRTLQTRPQPQPRFPALSQNPAFSRPPARPVAMPTPIRQPAPGQVLRRPTAVPYRLPTVTRPRSR